MFKCVLQHVHSMFISNVISCLYMYDRIHATARRRLERQRFASGVAVGAYEREEFAIEKGTFRDMFYLCQHLWFSRFFLAFEKYILCVHRISQIL